MDRLKTSRRAGLLLGLGSLAFAFGCGQKGDPVAEPAAKSPSSALVDAPAQPSTPSAATSASAAPSAAAEAAPAEGGMPKDLNVLVLTIDSMRHDMPWNGYPRDIAPVLTAFAKSAVNYSRAYAVSSYTAMSLAGFLAGRYPSELERSGYFFSHYPDTVTFFPELLQKAGVRTLSAHAHFYFDEKAGFRQGFDVYEIVPGLKKSNTTDTNITSPAHLELAEKILGDKANTGGKFFAWFHLMDPHDQYMSHEGIKYGTKARDKYDGEMTFVDQHVGKLLDFVAAQPWGDKTAVIISADHGEAFGEHGLHRHGFELYDVLTHVPLMIRAPGIKPRTIDTPRSDIDLTPTIMAMLGAPEMPDLQGKTLIPELYGAEPEAREVIVDLPRTSDNDRRRVLVKGDYALMAFGDDFAFKLFNLIEDPDEKKDLARSKDHAKIFEEMKAAYKAKSETIKDVCPKMTEKLKGKRKGSKC